MVMKLIAATGAVNIELVVRIAAENMVKLEVISSKWSSC